MIRFAVALALVSLLGAPAAAADPQDLVPGCTEGQVAAPGACAPAPEEEADDASLLGPLGGIPGAFPGANPNVPPTVLPLNFPVVLPLGPVPLHVPQNLPLGPTPPAVLPFQN